MKLTALTPSIEKKVRKNLRTLFDQATNEQLKSGSTWYKRAHDICLDYAKEFGTTTEIVANIISALSPRNKWERNIQDSHRVLTAVKRGHSPEDVKVCTFNTNKYKAFDIAINGATISKSAPKTYSFVRNISALDAQRVTIDVWHLRACFGKTIEGGLTPTRYKRLEEITIQEAKKVGLRGYEYQAIIWEVIRTTNDN
jgi:hypothetical protein